ncbi:rho guanine nucleotide exchange factor 8-like [Impatiens glandulifera]|uniref:rho guanine nucleotide exchange factor 8-like n=1 Tax=Impatiens glandulifera TaxID=253017 RepID=UPI001FB1A025|nr:rho guanine nucleotide exchange factor 8-like [Impatiens glandulifera]
MVENRIISTRSFNCKKMVDIPGRHTHSLDTDVSDDKLNAEEPIEEIDLTLTSSSDDTVAPAAPRLSNDSPATTVSRDGNGPPSDLDLLKEKFAKLLLGEDMSGGGSGVSSALALSNAVTNLAASIFGEIKRLEPMNGERKARWKKELEWLVSVTNQIVELVPSQQTNSDGVNMEIMTTKQRRDLLMNIPALKKLDAMLVECLDNFRNQSEFSYVSRDANESEQGVQRQEKWWLPTVKVPTNGLSDVSRKWMQSQKDCVNQVLKASMAINAQVISEMDVPDSYIESLPKNGRSSLGDSLYKSITADYFNPAEFFANQDLSSEHKVLDLKNRIEASVVIWQRKMHHKDGKSSSWGTSVSFEKREIFEERAETILMLLKQKFPGLPQSSLEISKIQYNRDVGHAVLESYSRVLETLANTVMSRIEDVLYADGLAQDPSQEACEWKANGDSEDGVQRVSSSGTPTSTTLFDAMGWNLDANKSPAAKEENGKSPNSKPPIVGSNKKLSYMEKLEKLGSLRSPTHYA